MVIKLQDIFISNKRISAREEFPALKLHDAFIEDLSRQLNLIYLPDNTSQNNVCFADSQEVRSEYRTSFGKTDLLNYINSLLTCHLCDFELDEIPFPENSAFFWTHVKNGSLL